MSCKLKVGFCRGGFVLLVASVSLFLWGCFSVSEIAEDPNTPTESINDDIYVEEGGKSHQAIVQRLEEVIRFAASYSLPKGYSPSFSIGEYEYLQSLEPLEISSVSYDVEFDRSLNGYEFSDLKAKVTLEDGVIEEFKSSEFNTSSSLPYFLQIWTFNVEDGIVQSKLDNSIYSDEIKQYVKEVFDTVQAEYKLSRGAITCVFKKYLTAGNFLARGKIENNPYTSGVPIEGLRDIYAYTVSGLEYLPAFTTITETAPDVELVSKYKTFVVHPEIFKMYYDVGPDDWEDTFDEGYRYGLSYYAETGYDEYGLYDLIDGWDKSRPRLGGEYAMSLKLQSKGDGFYITEGGWKVYSTNRQNAKALDDAWNSYSKTVSSYGLCYGIGIVPSGENKYELVLYARTRT